MLNPYDLMLNKKQDDGTDWPNKIFQVLISDHFEQIKFFNSNVECSATAAAYQAKKSIRWT